MNKIDMICFALPKPLIGIILIVGTYREDEDADESNPIPDVVAAYIFKREKPVSSLSFTL